MSLDLAQARAVVPRPVPATIRQPILPVTPFTIHAATTPFAAGSAPGKALEPLAGAGVRLTTYVLIILSAVLALLIGELIYQEKQFADVSSATLRATAFTAEAATVKTISLEQLKARQELLTTYQGMANASREFLAKMAQMILLNLLPPVLTALLGYVFASKAAIR